MNKCGDTKTLAALLSVGPQRIDYFKPRGRQIQVVPPTANRGELVAALKRFPMTHHWWAPFAWLCHSSAL
jgi:hypothetical protein